MNKHANFNGQKITIMGLGLHGGGVASARFFAEHGARVTVTDLKTERELQASIQALSDLPVRFVLAEHRVEDFANADMVIKNPDVRFVANPFLKQALCIESDISIFLQYTNAQIIAVTGSKGKSSTVSALYYSLKCLGAEVFLGGNITTSPLTFLSKTSKKSIVILELSSSQLGDLRDCNKLKYLHPAIAIITPIMPDHLNRYSSMSEYVADKKLIYSQQNERDITICNCDDQYGAVFAKETKAQVLWYSTKSLIDNRLGAWLKANGYGFMKLSGEAEPTEILANEIRLKGRAQRSNLLTVGLALASLGFKPEQIAKSLQDFPGIEHRMEFFHEKNGIRFYNDTAATIPQAVIAAIDSFQDQKASLIVLAGGMDKGLDMTALIEKLDGTKRVILLAGTVSDALVRSLVLRHIPFDGPFHTMHEAVLAIQASAEAGDTVLLSPAAASFNLFENEFDRGRQFKSVVKDLF